MSGASSMRNAVKRITHKERAQPSWNKKAGFLEKHKDYTIRARDYQKKQKTIKTLKKKASERNPDEFYFKMKNSKVVDGVHESVDQNSCLDMDTVKLLKTQDMGYIVHRKAIDDSKAKKLKETLHLLGESEPKSHKIFLDQKDEFDNFDAATHFDTEPELVDRNFNRMTKSQLKDDPAIANIKVKAVKRANRLRDQSYKELNRRASRAEKLRKAVNALQAQRVSMAKGSKRKIVNEDTGTVSYKFKRQRSS
jgi:U3 small nucleolar RNA-associated protein 11